MNIQKELEKIQKKKDRLQKRTEKIESVEGQYKAIQKRLQPFKDWWYAFNKEARYERQVQKIVKEIIEEIKMEYVRSLKINSSPVTHYPILIEHSSVFHEEEMDVFRLGKYGVKGFYYRKTKRILKSLHLIEKLGYLRDESLLKAVREVVLINHQESFHVSALQYEQSPFSTERKPMPYLILSIKGPHPRTHL